MSYNGYFNWETWNVCLWFDNEYNLYKEYTSMARREPFTAKTAKEYVTEIFPNGTPDFKTPPKSSYIDVDWQEVADCFNSCLE